MKMELIEILMDDYAVVDVDEEFEQYINDTYSFEYMGGPFEYMIPSCVLKEMSPGDYDAYQADWLDGQDYVEYEGYHWKKSDYEEALEIFNEQEDAK